MILDGGFKDLTCGSPTAGFARHDKSVDKSVLSKIRYFHSDLGEMMACAIYFPDG